MCLRRSILYIELSTPWHFCQKLIHNPQIIDLQQFIHVEWFTEAPYIVV